MADRRVVVLGAGSSGEHFVGALRRLDPDVEIVVVERELAGGECSYYACLPTKTLLRPTEVLAAARSAPGAAEAIAGEVDVERVLWWRDQVTDGRDDSWHAGWLEEQGAELTIWPEAAYPYVLDHDARHAPRGPTAILTSKVRGPIVVGLITRDQPVTLPSGQVETNSFNSAALVLPDGSMSAPYDKLQLLWFGEMVPGGAQLPWLRRIFQKSGGLIPGAAPRALAASCTESCAPKKAS